MSNPTSWCGLDYLELYGPSAVGYLNHPTQLSLSICANGALPTTIDQQVLTITSSGAIFNQTVSIPYLGIGTTSPDGCFHVAGIKSLTTGSTLVGGGGVQMGRDASPTPDACGIEVCSFSTAGVTGNNAYIDFTKPGLNFSSRIQCAHLDASLFFYQ